MKKNHLIVSPILLCPDTFQAIKKLNYEAYWSIEQYADKAINAQKMLGKYNR
jgi:hypothetical protein